MTNTTNTARAEYAAYCTEIGSDIVAEEHAILSVGREFLPAHVLAVRDGAEPDEAYWSWLHEQTRNAQEEQEREVAAGHEWHQEEV